MKCRRIYKWIDENEVEHNDIVWFGSYGRTEIEHVNIVERNKSTSFSNAGRGEISTILLENVKPNSTITLTVQFTTIASLKVYSINEEETSTLIINRTNVQTGSPISLNINRSDTKNVQIVYQSGASTAAREVNLDYIEIEKTIYYEYKTKFYNEVNKHDNYAYQNEGVKNSLIQRLSVIKNELWYNKNYGIPLLDKTKNKGEIDGIIINIILSQEDVISIEDFVSIIKDTKYDCYFIVNTIYGQIEGTI